MFDCDWDSKWLKVFSLLEDDRTLTVVDKPLGVEVEGRTVRIVYKEYA